MVEKRKNKKDLKKKVKKKLDKLKKKLPKKQYKKLAKKVVKKVDRTLGGQAISNIGRSLGQTIPPLPQIIQDPRLQAKELKDRLESGVKKEFNKPIKDFKNMKKAYDEVLKKYESGNLSPEDLFILYTTTKQFATTANDYIPSQAEIGSAYKTVKSKLNYFKNWINRNRPSGQSQVSDIPNTRPPPPPPPPPPSQEPTPTPSPPTPPPTPPPTLQNIYDSIPSVSPQVLTVGIGALATGGILNRLNQANQRIMGNERQIQNLGRGIGNQLAENIAEQSLGQVIDSDYSQTLANLNSNLNEMENIFDEVVSSNKETLNNRNIRQGSVPPLRQRTRDTRLRSSIGEKQRKSKFADKRIPKTEFKIPTQKEMDEAEVEQELGVGMVPLTSKDIREEIRTEKELDPTTDSFEEPTDTEVLERIQEQQEAQNLADRFNRQREELNLPQMPNVPQREIQTRTEEDIMEGLLN